MSRLPHSACAPAQVKDEIVARLRSAGAGQVSFALIARAADKYVAPHTPGGGSLGAHVVLSHMFIAGVVRQVKEEAAGYHAAGL